MVKRTLSITILIFLSGFIIATSINACRYTVREIGFSDIGSIPYQAYFFVNSDTPADDISTITKLSFALFYEANVRLKVVNIDEEKDAKILSYLEKHNLRSFPSLVLVSPQESSAVYSSVIYKGRTFNESAWLLMESLVWSPVRKSLVDQLMQSYCVVLFFEGSDASANRIAMKEVREAVGDITQTLDQMPKIVHTPPHIQVVGLKDLEGEKVLLNSIGLNEKGSTYPSVAIIYGRGRILGPVLHGEQIVKRILFNLLTVVGADCECGLDQSWILSRMLPLRWESAVQSELAEILGFDVESPMVKTEMSQIVSIKPDSENPMNPMDINLLGYTESGVETEIKPEGASKISAYDIQKSFSHKPSLKSNLALSTVLFGLGGIALIVSLAGLYIYLKFKRGSPKP